MLGSKVIFEPGNLPVANGVSKKLVHYHHFTPLAVLTKLFYTWRPYKILKCILQEKCGISRRYVCKG